MADKIWKIGKFEVKASRWPNQGYGWFPHKRPRPEHYAPLNPSGSRFGAGWDYKLGISISGRTVMLDLLFGIIVIRKVA